MFQKRYSIKNYAVCRINFFNVDLYGNPMYPDVTASGYNRKGKCREIRCKSQV